MTFRLDGDIQDRCDTTQSSLMSSDHLKGKAWRVRICFSVSNVEIHRRFSHVTFKSFLPAVLLTAKQKRVMKRGVSCEISWTMADACSLMNAIIILIRPAFDSTSKPRGSDFIGTFFYLFIMCVPEGGWVAGLWRDGLLPWWKKRKEEGRKNLIYGWFIIYW